MGGCSRTTDTRSGVKATIPTKKYIDENNENRICKDNSPPVVNETYEHIRSSWEKKFVCEIV